MEALQSLGVLLGSTWASGVRLYGTVALLGMAHRMEWMHLPGDLDVLAHPLVIGTAALLYAAETLGDKVPWLDSLLDFANTIMKPLGGGALAYMAASEAGPAIQTAAALLGGGVSLTTHAVKSSTRAVVNTSPEPVTNVATSTAEDGLMIGGLYILFNNPVLMAILVVLFLVFAFWFLRKMGQVLGRLFRWKKQPAPATAGGTAATMSNHDPAP